MIIRNYVDTDLQDCRSLWAEMVERHRDLYNDPSIGGDVPGVEFDNHLANVGAECIWVADVEKGVVGFAALMVDGEQAEVEPMIVTSKHRGGGIGRKLLERVAVHAKELGVLCLNVKPVARNEDAISFFYDAGFRTLGHIQMFQWLGESFPGQWKRGSNLYGKDFEY